MRTRRRRANTKESYRLNLFETKKKFFGFRNSCAETLRKYPHFVKVSFVWENIDSPESQVNGMLLHVRNGTLRPALLLLFGRLRLATKAHRPTHYLFAVAGINLSVASNLWLNNPVRSTERIK